MRGRTRIHFMAIGTITAVVFLMYLAVGPKQSKDEPQRFAGNYYVQINGATWGLNCIDHIEHEIEQAKIARNKLSFNEREKVKMPVLATRNNALSHLSQLCNGKEICAFLAESDIIGFDPIHSCFKDLELSYRCYDIDRLRHITFRQGSMARLDCSPKAIGIQ